MPVSPFALKRQAAVRPMREPAQAGQFSVLTLAQTGKDLADHAVHAVRRLPLRDARLPRHSFRDFRLLHPISIYQRGASPRPRIAAEMVGNSLIFKVIRLCSGFRISGDRADEPILIAA
jgi:hypothetical protein